MAPDFPEMTRMEARTDGCPNQFDYGTNYHQTAEWRSIKDGTVGARLRQGPPGGG